MSLINTEIKPFTATAFHNGEFVDVSDADLKGKWSVVFFYPADFTFVCPTELGDLADNYAELQGASASRSTRSRPTPTSPTRRGTTPPTPSARSSTRWSATRPAPITPQLRRDASRARAWPTAARSSIDPDGVIQLVEITAEGIGRNAAELLRKVKAAQYVARAPGRGLPGQVGRGRRHPRPVARPRRQDLIARSPGAVRPRHRPAPHDPPLAPRPPPAPPTGAIPVLDADLAAS